MDNDQVIRDLCLMLGSGYTGPVIYTTYYTGSDSINKGSSMEHEYPLEFALIANIETPLPNWAVKNVHIPQREILPEYADRVKEMLKKDGPEGITDFLRSKGCMIPASLKEVKNG